MVSTGLTADWVADLPYGLALPVLEMMRICQHSPGRDWPAEAYEFVGRTDLAMQSLGQFPANDPTSEVGQSRLMESRAGAEQLIPQDELDKQPTVGELMALAKEGARVKQMAQPMLPHVRFGSDKRLAEVERIMQTTRARTISVHDPKVVG
jgi:anaphase-promoting complex subunit 1